VGGDERAIDGLVSQGHTAGSAEPGVRPLSAALRRHAVSLTSAQSDAVARLLVPGVRRLVELIGLRNGTLCATLRGAGYAALRVYVTPDGRVVENAEASEPDPLGDETEPFVLARDPDRLHLGTLRPAEERAERGERTRLHGSDRDTRDSE
jgi:hypothetical protein